MSDSRLKKAARADLGGWLGFCLTCLLCMGGVLSWIPGGAAWAGGFEALESFENSKKRHPPLTLHALPDPAEVQPGDTFRLYVVAELNKGWHLYSLEKQSEDETVPSRIELEAAAFPSQGPWLETPPQLVRDEVMQKIMKTHSGRVEFSRVFSVPKGTQPGAYPLNGTLRFRTCDNRICTLPQSLKFQTHVIVESGEPG